MTGYRSVCLVTLKVAIPLLVFQLLFITPLPDAFGFNQDFVSLSHLNHLTKIKFCGISDVNRNDLIEPVARQGEEVAIYQVVFTAHRRIWSYTQKLAPPDGAAAPHVLRITENPVHQKKLPDTDRTIYAPISATFPRIHFIQIAKTLKTELPFPDPYWRSKIRNKTILFREEENSSC